MKCNSAIEYQKLKLEMVGNQNKKKSFKGLNIESLLVNHIHV